MLLFARAETIMPHLSKSQLWVLKTFATKGSRRVGSFRRKRSGQLVDCPLGNSVSISAKKLALVSATQKPDVWAKTKTRVRKTLGAVFQGLPIPTLSCGGVLVYLGCD